MSGVAYTPEEMLVVEAARRIPDGAVCFVGIGMPTLAAGVARATHAPGCVLVFESGAMGAKPSLPPRSIADGDLAESADFIVSTPEVFAYWLGGGKIDIGFLGAAQVDRRGNLNSTVIGGYDHPRVRLPGAGGAPEIAAASATTIALVPHTLRGFVERVDFRSTIGQGDDPASREALGLPGAGVQTVVTDLGVLVVDPARGELVLGRVHPGVDVDAVRDRTGWPLVVSPELDAGAPPTTEELAALRAFVSAPRPGGFRTALEVVV